MTMSHAQSDTRTDLDVEEVRDTDAPLLEIRNVTKTFGSVISLSDISTTVRAGQVTCVLGDNGAGKSTFIKMLSGVHRPDKGELLMDGALVHFNEPRDALDAGIATVFQDLAMVPLMAIWRNFFLGSEPTKGWGPFKRFDAEKAKRITREEMHSMGIDIRDPDQPVGTLSGGERQCVAIARAVHFGARLLILDEPTSALGVKQSGVVLKYIVQARDRGLGVIFITHNPHHAYPVGDRFLLLKRGKSLGDYAKADITLSELTGLMAGGAELEQLAHELEREGDSEAAAIGSDLLADTRKEGSASTPRTADADSSSLADTTRPS
jgi:simple sugar transport system ATP-binding protein